MGLTGSEKNIKVLAIASSGGHWIQLLRLKPALTNCDVVFASTNKSNGHDVPDKFYYFTDANRKTFWKFFIMIFQLLRIIYNEKPKIILTTGSAPGMMALAVGKLFSTRNIWIDSIANVEKLSTSGKIANRFADLYLTQWKDLAKPDGRPKYCGTVI